MAKEYFILSVGNFCDGFCLWWRPNNAGYTTDIDAAGRYSHEDITKRASYYNSGTGTKAIPCDAVERIATRHVLMDRSIECGAAIAKAEGR